MKIPKIAAKLRRKKDTPPTPEPAVSDSPYHAEHSLHELLSIFHKELEKMSALSDRIDAVTAKLEADATAIAANPPVDAAAVTSVTALEAAETKVAALVPPAAPATP